MNNYIGMIFPSQNNNASKLQNMLKWGNRAYALFSLLLFWIIRWSINGVFKIDNTTFIYLFMLQAAILLYVFQTYRRYFALSQNLGRKKYLYMLSGLWLIIFLLYNFLQIVLSSAYAMEMSFSYAWIINSLLPLALAAAGEYLYRKTAE